MILHGFYGEAGRVQDIVSFCSPNWSLLLKLTSDLSFSFLSFHSSQIVARVIRASSVIFFLSNRNWHSVRLTFNQGTWKIRTGGLPPTQSWPVLLSELKAAYKKEQAIFSKRGSIVAMKKNKVIELIQSHVSQFLDYVPSFKSFCFCRSL